MPKRYPNIVNINKGSSHVTINFNQPDNSTVVFRTFHNFLNCFQTSDVHFLKYLQGKTHRQEDG